MREAKLSVVQCWDYAQKKSVASCEDAHNLSVCAKCADEAPVSLLSVASRARKQLAFYADELDLTEKYPGYAIDKYLIMGVGLRVLAWRS